MKNSPKAVIGSSKRKEEKSITPGPLQYDPKPQFKWTKTFRFPTCDWSNDIHIFEAPGPNHYDISNSNMNKAPSAII